MGGHIHGTGHGDAHNWVNHGTSVYRSTYYRCQDCGTQFWHDYGIIADIFKAMKKAGVPIKCKKKEA